MHGGTAVIQGDKTYKCNCVAQYTGTYCEQGIAVIFYLRSIRSEPSGESLSHVIYLTMFGIQQHRIMAPTSTGKARKMGNIFQSGKNRGIVNMLEKVREFYTKHWKSQEILYNLTFFL